MGDDLLGPIETCRANDVNTFDYLVWALDNHEKLFKVPMNFTPWIFKQLSASPPENRRPKDCHSKVEPEAWRGSAISPPHDFVATI
jgi:hypothetical protein